MDEIRLSGGPSLFLGESAAVKRVPSSTSSLSGFDMLRGSAVVTTGKVGVVATCSNEVTLSDSGLYRFDVIPLPELPTGEKVCGFRVYEGAAAVKLATVVSVLTPGKFLGLNLRCGIGHLSRNSIPSLPTPWTIGAASAFDCAAPSEPNSENRSSWSEFHEAETLPLLRFRWNTGLHTDERLL